MCLHHQVQRGWGDRTYQDGGKFPVPLVTKLISPPLCLVQSRGTRTTRDAQRKGRDSRGNCEIRQGTNVSRTLCKETLIPCTLPFPPFTPQGVIWMEGTARNHPALTLS